MNTAAESIHVLHVDDESDIAELAAEFLEREDDRFAVDTATSASDGMDLIDEHDYDCIVSDYEMPRQDGIDFLEAENEQLRERVDELETDLDRTRNEKRLLLEEREEKAELVRYVEQERTAEQRLREAGIATRIKWSVFGMPSGDTSA